MYSLGISTCPNDTFAFHAILEQRIDLRGLTFDVQLHDVQYLNERVAAGALDLSKISYHAAIKHRVTYAMLAAGSALGFGVGPLLLARKGAPPLSSDARVLTPGELTTAHLLFRAFYPAAATVDTVVFSEIMPMLQRGEADYGVVIHEGRFTYKDWGLELVSDLGKEWETRYALPLPLGGIAIRRDSSSAIAQTITTIVRESIAYADTHREEAFETMRRYAAELAPDVIWAHVDLYVNEWTRDLGEVGRRAISTFEGLAQQAGYASPNTPLLVG